jgi:hypothetical protein
MTWTASTANPIPLDTYVSLPSTAPTTYSLNADRLYYSGTLRIDQPVTLDSLAVAVTVAGDGSSVLRVGVAKRSTLGTSVAETLTPVASFDTTAVAELEVTSIAVDLSAGLWDFWAVSNGETSTRATFRACTPGSEFASPFMDINGGVRGRNCAATAATVSGALPATVPAMNSDFASTVQLVAKVTATS